MKLYIVNHYVGGTPMDGETIGVFDSYDKAVKCMNDAFEDFNIPTEDIEDRYENQIYWDLDDYWGGLEIEEKELNKSY